MNCFKYNNDNDNDGELLLGPKNKKETEYYCEFIFIYFTIYYQKMQRHVFDEFSGKKHSTTPVDTVLSHFVYALSHEQQTPILFKAK